MYFTLYFFAVHDIEASRFLFCTAGLSGTRLYPALCIMFQQCYSQHWRQSAYHLRRSPIQMRIPCWFAYGCSETHLRTRFGHTYASRCCQVRVVSARICVHARVKKSHRNNCSLPLLHECFVSFRYTHKISNYRHRFAGVVSPLSLARIAMRHRWAA